MGVGGTHQRLVTRIDDGDLDSAQPHAVGTRYYATQIRVREWMGRQCARSSGHGGATQRKDQQHGAVSAAPTNRPIPAFHTHDILLDEDK